ncbi:filamentous hemagglutinin family N-terminal domain protein [Neisseria meningitidis 77221]|nr:filamentous hemagglutinin family N-terminal domain protein [Neisseria meningitidis 77221]
MDKAAENLGPAGKAAVNALGGAAIGYAAGGNVGTAAVGANVDWNNRQLHDSEIRKIKDNAAKFAKLHPGISQRQAEERLVAHAMRQVDAAYYAKHADTDTAAEQFLRSIAESFKADGETFLDFAPMKYYRDSGKFAEQQGYRETREQLKRNAVSSYTERSRQIRDKTFDTATAGIGKGIANLPSSYVNGFIGLYNGTIGKPVGKEAPYVPLIMEYDNPIEEEVGAWAADKFDRAAGMLTGIKAGAVSSGRGAWNKNGKTGAGQKTGEMSVLDGEMAGSNKLRKQANHEINKLKSADEINFADGMGKFTDSMNDKAFSKLVKSVKENGFTNPVVEYVEINGKAYIVRGNNRVFAAEYLGRIHELKFKKVDFPVPNTSWKNPTDVLNESGNVKRPRYRSK